MNGDILSARVKEVLRCPLCADRLCVGVQCVQCATCGQTFSTTGGRLDLRLPRQKELGLRVRVGQDLDSAALPEFSPIGSDGRRLWRGIVVPPRLTADLLDRFPTPYEPGELALDCGCGTAPHKPLLEALGFEYVGIDIKEPEATALADAHALPFADASFGFVISIALLEHVRYPFVVVGEIFRVLRPGGALVGSVSFHEPYHAQSYYHCTHLGVMNLLTSAGFSVSLIGPSCRWDSFESQASMGLFPRMPIWVARALVLPLRAFRALWFAVGYAATNSAQATPLARALFNTGAYIFVAHKPDQLRA